MPSSLGGSIKQRTISNSTTKAKYIALGHAARKSVWIRKFLNKLNVADPIGACILHKNNETSIVLTKNAESQVRTKHINMQHHYICKLVANKEVTIEWICSASILADGFMKFLSVDNFRRHQNLLGLAL